MAALPRGSWSKNSWACSPGHLPWVPYVSPGPAAPAWRTPSKAKETSMRCRRWCQAWTGPFGDGSWFSYPKISSRVIPNIWEGFMGNSKAVVPRAMMSIEKKKEQEERGKIPFLEGTEEICVLLSWDVIHSHQNIMLFASMQLLGGLCVQGKARCYSEQSCWRGFLPTQEMKGGGYSHFPPPFGADFGLRNLLRSPQPYTHVVLWSQTCPSHCVGLPGRRYGSFSCWFGMVFVSADEKLELFCIQL